MKRKIIKIDESLCDGCGNCIPNCAEGALQLIDGKARLISDLFCDGLGACLGHCPQGAIVVEEREAEPYDELKVMEYIVNGGINVINAHLIHLKQHGEMVYYSQAVSYLRSNNLEFDVPPANSEQHSGCPGSKEMFFNNEIEDETSSNVKQTSQLRQWPIQLHLVSPMAQYYCNSNLLLAADCTSFAYANFHNDFLKSKSLAIACPKLDTNKQVYLEKLITMINDNNLQSITVLIMEVPCCGGLFALAKQAVEYSNREIPVNAIVVTINGNIKNN